MVWKSRSRASMLAVAGTLGVSLLAAACGGGDDGDKGEGEGAAGPSEVGAGSDEDPAASAQEREGERDGTPLEKFFDEAWGGEPVDVDEAEDQERQIQELVAQCMQDEGFEYVPYVPDFSYYEGIDDDPDLPWNLPEDEFVEKYGYGIATIDYRELGGENNDPNQAIVDGLSDPEREAYDLALHGEPPELDDLAGEDFTGTEEVVVGSGGCWGDATEQVVGVDAGEPVIGEDDSAVMAFWDDVEAVHQRVNDDPRVQDAAAAWSSCMADADFPGYDLPMDAEESLWDEWDVLLGGDEPGGSEDALASAEAGGDDPQDIRDLVDPDDLADFQARELETAQADHACRKESEYDQIHYDVTVELEQQYLDENQDELEKLKESDGFGVGVG